MSLVIKRASGPRDLEQALALRLQVFSEEQGIPRDLEIDGRDDDADHVLVLDAGLPVATGRLLQAGAREGVLARIAVRAEHRGRGVGRIVVRELEAIARERGFERVMLQPHDHLEPFYAGLGYRRSPGTDSVAGHVLINMWKPL